ncbi:hypothetical protein [Mycobacterium uberis]|uniref:hypothetical protein n=1 Tax=Mycobacterium uberis TaxID=2162698 RepID=UPI0010589FDD|nr:hypothetical protein [Mycobacterium uberis]
MVCTSSGGIIGQLAGLARQNGRVFRHRLSGLSCHGTRSPSSTIAAAPLLVSKTPRWLSGLPHWFIVSEPGNAGAANLRRATAAV